MARGALLTVLLVAAVSGCHLASTGELMDLNPKEALQWDNSPFPIDNSTEFDYAWGDALKPSTWQDELDAEVAAGNWTESRRGRMLASCNYARGYWRWSYNRPAYSSKCPFIRTEFNCVQHGRKNRQYQRWYWKPFGCQLPQFSPYFLGSFMRNKVLAIIGNSFRGNFGQSLICQFARDTPTVKYVTRIAGTRVTGVRIPKYNLRIVYINSPYLVRYSKEASDFAKLKLKQSSFFDYLVWLDEIDPAWKTAFKSFDMAIFLSGHWFQVAQGSTTVRSRNFILKGRVQKSMTGLGAYKIALTTFRNFLQRSGFKGVPMFLTYSPSHFSPPVRGQPDTCKATRPFSYTGTVKFSNLPGSVTSWANVEKSVLRGYWRIRIIDINFMSSARPDGHVALNYGAARNSKTKWDCLHWCLPGVPDGWTDVFQYILRSQVKRL